MPSRRLAEKAVERFGLLQVHGFPAPTHVPLPLELAPPKGGERPAALRPRNGDSASWQRQRNAPRCRRLLVAGNPCGTCCFAPNPCSSLPSFGRALNPVAPHDDKRVIAMTNEGRPGPPHCGVSGRRLAARAYARRAPPDEMLERILTCFWCCRDWRFLVAPSGLAAGQGRARRHHWGHSRLRSGQQIQLDPRLLRMAGGIPATGAAMTAPVDYGQRFFEGSRKPSALGGDTAFAFQSFVERGCVSTRPMD